jgi:hypothetical protein
MARVIQLVLMFPAQLYRKLLTRLLCQVLQKKKRKKFFAFHKNLMIGSMKVVREKTIKIGAIKCSVNAIRFYRQPLSSITMVFSF